MLLRCFLQDPKRSGKYIVDDMKYARAALRCLKVVCTDSLPRPDRRLHLKTEVGTPVTSPRSMFEIITANAYLECIAALLPKAAIAEDLLSLIAKNKLLLTSRKTDKIWCRKLLKVGEVVPDHEWAVAVYLRASYFSSLVCCRIAERATARSRRK